VIPLVLDASAVVDVLVGRDPEHQIRQQIHAASAMVHTVAHLDAEVLSTLGRLHRARELSADDVDRRLWSLSSMRMHRLPITSVLLADAWRLRDNVALRDALYVAAAMRLGGMVLTTDDRLRRAAPDHTIGPA
jgi:predicted nucleic acid-binding protein